MHFLKKTAAFTAADVDLCGEILERQMLHIMAVDVVEQNAEPLNITRCRRVLGFTGKRCVAVNLNPDRQQKLPGFPSQTRTAVKARGRRCGAYRQVPGSASRSPAKRRWRRAAYPSAPVRRSASGSHCLKNHRGKRGANVVEI